MNQTELDKILENHNHWINKDCEGWEDMKADLRYTDLYCANLSDADLRYANLTGANLYCANLNDADLRYTDLRYANLTGANLYCANLYCANLSDANLYCANLSDADLYCADLSYANLNDADLNDADLRYTDLRYANLRYANLYCANISEAKNIPFIPFVCPDYGSFIAYKKAGEYIVELEIPEDAKRLSATTRKCRCNKAKVLRILNKDRTVADITEVASNRDKEFIYKVGEIVSVNDFDDNRWNECSTGIHFFINFEEAVKYCD